jgi:hypothetical protein
MSKGEIQISLKEIQTRYSVPSIQGPLETTKLELLNDINFLDRDYFDHSQFDTKVAEKNIYSKYLAKEAIFVTRLVIETKRRQTPLKKASH